MIPEYRAVVNYTHVYNSHIFIIQS
jgi:hypothetical protein